MKGTPRETTREDLDQLIQKYGGESPRRPRPVTEARGEFPFAGQERVSLKDMHRWLEKVMQKGEGVYESRRKRLATFTAEGVEPAITFVVDDDIPDPSGWLFSGMVTASWPPGGEWLSTRNADLNFGMEDEPWSIGILGVRIGSGDDRVDYELVRKKEYVLTDKDPRTWG